MARSRSSFDIDGAVLTAAALVKQPKPRKRQAPSIAPAGAPLVSFDSRPPPTARADARALSHRGSWSLALDNGARVVIGRESPEARLERFIDTLPRIAAADGAVWVRADLRYANGYALEWRMPEPAPPAPELPSLSAPGPQT